ncbi:MAG: 4-(cytidine 5'-diphospho)-2-C-methyl-D-erythritol kinase [Pseudomonadota bacterium]|nr:4-(cytidine 5'-diphospho)-2-C-methyl-D-erythritol kinase [Pseudomonadota bacterium]
MEEVAFAKINLALHVRGREPDGYHRLETIFAFAEDGDRLHVAEAVELSLTVAGPFASSLQGEADNLVLRAANALRTRCGIAKGAALVLDKVLPVASGIGGGSADAAATLRLLNRFWAIGAPDALLLDIAASLGADVPACIRSETVRGEGRGDRLKPVDGSGLSGTPLLLVNPGMPVSTAAIFGAWDGIDRGPLADGLLEASLRGRNDLEPAAIGLASEIKAVLGSLSGMPGLLLARMSGSGATCFALFHSEAALERASVELAAARPEWWRLTSRLR